VGLDYDSVARVNADVIYLCSQGFGLGGPLGEAPASVPLNSTFAGVKLHVEPRVGTVPAGVSLNHPDHIASKLGTVAVARRARASPADGEGQRIEMSQSEALRSSSARSTSKGRSPDVPRRRTANSAEHAVPHGVYPCEGQSGEERWVAIAVVGDEAFERLRTLCGWRPIRRRRRSPDDSRHAEAIDERLGAWTRSRTAEDVAAKLQAAGISAMVVQNGDDHRADAHFAERGAIVTVHHPDLGDERHVASPVRLSRTPLARPLASPMLGADTKDVLRDRLGLAVRRDRPANRKRRLSLARKRGQTTFRAPRAIVTRKVV